jgi:site-specific recombinase XerD
MKPTHFPALLERFFTARWIRQRQASPHTIASYRDTFRLLLQFAQRRLRKPPAHLRLAEIDAPLITAFLDDLEVSRQISARSRNHRLTAMRSFFHYVAYEEPAHSLPIQRVLAMPGQRFSKPWCRSSTAQKLKRSWQPRIGKPGLAAAITRCY